MAFNFKSEEEVKEYLQNIGTEYRFSCFKEKNSEGCHLLGDYLEAVKKEFDSAAKVYQTNCDEYKYAKSCLKYGNFCYLGKGPAVTVMERRNPRRTDWVSFWTDLEIQAGTTLGVEKNFLTALAYYRKACDLNLPEGCLHKGVMLTQESKIEKNYIEGLKSLEKSCSLGNATACYFASGLYIAGIEGIPKDKTKASGLSLLACNGGNIFACMNLSQMYKVGDGVDKDEKKANEFKERAKEIRDDMKRKRTIGLQQYA